METPYTESKERKYFLEGEDERIRLEKEEKNKILSIIKESVSKGMFIDIEECLSYSSHCYDYKITEKPIGQKQSEDYEYLKYLWVNQTTNGGYTGDEFAGTISIKIGKDKYFTFSYSD